MLTGTADPIAVGAPAADCAHCTLPVPEALRTEGEERQFCCAGCRAAWFLIHETGLGGYYDFPERRDRAVESSGRGYAEFDHPAFHALHVRPARGGLLETDLYLEGVHCASCVWLVERVPLAQFALKHRMPTMFGTRENVEAGGLLGYAPDQADLTRQAATYIDKILKGDKPAGLPVEQASKYRLSINLKTAKVLGIHLPSTLLALADDLIE